jgi:hypothetical protein
MLKITIVYIAEALRLFGILCCVVFIVLAIVAVLG